MCLPPWKHSSSPVPFLEGSRGLPVGGREVGKRTLPDISSSWPEPLIQEPPALARIPLRWEPLVQAAVAGGSLPHSWGLPGSPSPSGDWRGSQSPASAHCEPGPVLGTGTLRCLRCPGEVPRLPTRTSKCSSNPHTELKLQQSKVQCSACGRSGRTLPCAPLSPPPGLLISKGCRGSESGEPTVSQRLILY